MFVELPVKEAYASLYAALQLVAMRRDAEGTLEGAAEMRRAQLRHPGKVGERDILRQMRLDIVAGGALLPGGEPAPRRHRRGRAAALEPDQLDGQHRA